MSGEASGKVLAMVLAGGRGMRLQPLTQNNAKASLILGGYRLIDFVLGNLINSGIDSIYLLAQHQSSPLVEHVHDNWTLAANNGERFVRVVIAPEDETEQSSQGAATAVARNIDLIERHEPDVVAVFAADQVCHMNVRQMVDYHHAKNADVTVAVTQVPLEQAAYMDVVESDDEGRILAFQKMNAGPNRFGEVCVSMGNYLFDPEVLMTGLEQLVWCGESSFRRHFLPRLVHSQRVCAYDFSDNQIPGIRPYEEACYWRCIKTLEDYVDVLEDVGSDHPRFRLQNPLWPVLPSLAVQRPLFDARYAQPLVAHRFRSPGTLSFTVDS